VICLDPLEHGVLSNISNIFESMFLVLLRRLSLSTGFLNLDDLRKSPFGEDGSRPPSGADEAPSAIEGGRLRGRCIVRGD
jgi:hypothetical protein